MPAIALEESMTSRERWQAVLSGNKPDRWPTDFWSTGEVLDRLLKELRLNSADDLWQMLKIDRPFGIGGKYCGPDFGDRSIWGLRHVKQTYADGAGIYDEVVEHPLAAAQTVEDIEKYPWPSPDWFDFSHVKERLAQAGDRVVQGGGYEPFPLYCQMRGLEQAFIDLLESPEIVDAAIGKLFDFHYAINERLYDAGGGRIDTTYVAEDLGSQTSLLMSLDVIRRILLPRIRKMIQLAHDRGIKVLYHTDGAARPVIPLLIEAGIDALNPVQWRCPGMEREGLARDFGDKIAFHGAVDNQQTLPFGTAADVRNEVRENVEIFGKTKGYVIAPCHNIQPVSPTENILALYEAAQEYGKL
jgi:uroporphyrinogen decarboxylase